jgi:DNA-binding XRE family transcriptional regulator
MAIDSRVSQVDFAKAANIRSTTYNQWETGENFPGLEYTLALCDRYTGLTLDWIYRGKKEGMPSWLSNAITVLEEAERRSGAAAAAMKVVQPRRQRKSA